MSDSLTHQAIRLLVERGFPMIPSSGREKSPCVAWKVFQTQLPTVEQLCAWAKKFRPERWGLVTGWLSRRVIVDFDGDQGREWMRKWDIKPHLRTGSGGYHCHLLHPGWRVPTLNARSAKVSWPWPGVDIRGDGGFAVVLGRNSNGPYVQLRELDPEPFEVLPEEVRTFLQQHGGKQRETSERTSSSQPFNVGGNRVDPERLIRNALEIAHRAGRNDAGFWLACQLRDNGDEFGAAESAMRSYLVHQYKRPARAVYRARDAGNAIASVLPCRA